MKTTPPARRLVLLSALFAAVTGSAWDYEGHRMVNQLALAALPADFPAFVREPANAARIAFLAGEPDRWRNVPDGVMKQSGGSWTDHFCDLEQLPAAGLDPAKVPSFRFDFILQFAAGRATHRDKFPIIDPAKNTDHTSEWPGFAPWAITEYYLRLKSGFSYLKVFEELGTPDEVANARANVVYVMGVMGHYVGDCAQPLHTTVHHNGWVGANPNGYTTWPGFHSWIDGGFVAKAGLKLADIAPGIVPAQPLALAKQADGRDPFFVATMNYLIEQNKLVEPLYALEKKGVFKAEVAATSTEAQDFIKARFLTGGQMLASIWITAWKNAEDDKYLRASLIKRAIKNTP
ncbi:hypothetical protein [Opitutus sp. GAS368]|uniref:hypothetical protein n=1 Tax=Opitutus sp. GAS368 TaxID=1882749 RepID=UPI000879B7DB|nr:hypothetical protein [Opitutus sp. GAS368]SDS15455.1 hypothetical protein SAMN05444173_2044 [Opitutus sp. GAS368]